jgi:hypothetical protein
MIKSVIIIFFFCVEFCVSQNLIISAAEDNPKDNHKLFLYNPTVKSWQLFYRNDAISFIPYSTGAISPNGKFVAVWGFHPHMSREKNGEGYSASELIVIDSKGKAVFVKDSVAGYSWAPDSKSITWIEGITPERWEAPLSTRIGIYSIVKNSTIDLGRSRAVEIKWNSYDNRIYVLDSGNVVYRYDPERHVKDRTNYKGIVFSPDGKYYFDEADGGGLYSVYDAGTNQKITLGIEKRGMLPINNFADWVPYMNHSLVFGKVLEDNKSEEMKIFNVETKKQIQALTGPIVGYDAKNKQILIRKDKTIEAKSLSNE